MKIIVDAFGGDHAPLEILRGASGAVKEYGVEILAVGDEEKMRACARENGIDLTGIELLHAPGVLPMDAESAEIRHNRDSSIVVGLMALADGRGDAMVSAGSTGGLLTAATLFVKRIKGVTRAALGTVIPGAQKSYMLLDCGANAECRPEMLVQFGAMGAAYMEKVMGRQNPSVALANIGTEEGKGNALYKEAHRQLRDSGLYFTGNIEAREIPQGSADVVVADGFTGNIILKLTEGLAKFLMGKIKAVFTKNGLSKLAYLLVKGGLREFKATMDYTEYGGAPLLGIAKPVIKAHGSSNAKAFKNAVRQAKECCENGVVAAIAENLARTGAQVPETAE